MITNYWLARNVRKKVKKPKPEFMVDLFERLHPQDNKKFVLPKTNTKKKVNTFATFRPKPGYCLDYNISQTDAKLDAGDTKINLCLTNATYVPVRPEDLPKEEEVKKRKIRYGHGGPPVYEFLDEIYKRHVEKLQRKYRLELIERMKRIKREEIAARREWAKDMKRRAIRKKPTNTTHQ